LKELFVSLIVAVGKDGQIGLNGDIPFKSNSDLKRFKYLTLGKTLLMGRKTYESIGKPLPGRQTIVLSSDPDFGPDNVFVVRSVKEALDMAELLGRELMVSGGQRVYEDFAQYAGRIYLTNFDYIGPADAYFPMTMLHAGWNTMYVEKDGFRIFDRKL